MLAICTLSLSSLHQSICLAHLQTLVVCHVERSQILDLPSYAPKTEVSKCAAPVRNARSRKSGTAIQGTAACSKTVTLRSDHHWCSHTCLPRSCQKKSARDRGNVVHVDAEFTYLPQKSILTVIWNFGGGRPLGSGVGRGREGRMARSLEFLKIVGDFRVSNVELSTPSARKCESDRD